MIPVTGEWFVRANGVELCVDTIGDPRDPAVLLISGAAASMDWWDDEFCRRLADGPGDGERGRYVIRYDHRDTGRSVHYPAGAPGYSAPHLMADAVGVLDALGILRAHLVGVSMGGSLAQQIAVHYPLRVNSLVLISTSPAGPDNPDLPPMSDALRVYFTTAQAPDWSDRAAVLETLVTAERAFAAPEYFDEPRVRALAERVVERTTDVAASMTNHWQIGGGESVRASLGELRVPALIVHGTADPLFPYGHAEALAREIPDTELLPLPGVGHQVPPPQTWDVVVPAILRHTTGGWQARGHRLAARSAAVGDPTGWFDQLYAEGAAGDVPMPWDRDVPHPLLVTWAATWLAGNSPRGNGGGGGRSAVVVGCGLGADAEYIAGLGYRTTGFDISPTAIRLAQQRHPDSAVTYLAADLLDPPAEWWRAFDLVIEIITVQALPEPVRSHAIGNVGRLVTPGGTLLVIAAAADGSEPAGDGPPWPLTRNEIDGFAVDGLTLVRLDTVFDPRAAGDRRWRAEFHRPAGDPAGTEP